MEFTVRTLSEEPGLRERFPEFHRLAWPRFVHEGNGAGPLWPLIFTDFADFQFGLWDEAGSLVAIGNSIPLICDGSMADLPPDIPEILERGVAVKRDGRRLIAVKYPKDGAGILSSIVQSDGFAVIGEDVSDLAPGAAIDFLPFSEVFG